MPMTNSVDVKNPVILVAVENLSGGGAERVAASLATHWHEAGFGVVLLVAKLEGEYLKLLPGSMIVFEVGVATLPVNTFKYVSALKGLNKEHNFVGVVSHMSSMNRMILRAKALGTLQCPVVVVEHNNFLANNRLLRISFLRWIFLSLEIGFLYKKATKVVGVSQGVTNQIGRLFSLPIDKMQTICNPITDVNKSMSLLDKSVVNVLGDMEKPIIVSIGRLVPQKRFSDLLKMFAALDGGSLVILGDGIERKLLQALANELGVMKRVYFPGFVDSPLAILQASDLYVSSSIYEGYPLTLLEAYSQGLPVVSRSCDFGPEEIVTKDRPGRLVRTMDLYSLVEAVKEEIKKLDSSRRNLPIDFSENEMSHVALKYRNALGETHLQITSSSPVKQEKQRLRVLMLAPQLGYGGAEGSLIRLANYLSQFFDVKIVLFQKNYGVDSYTDSSVAVRVPVHILDEQANFGLLKRWFLRWFRLSIIKKDSDVVISFLSGPNLLNALSKISVPTVVSERGSKKYDIGMPIVKRLLWTKLLDPFIYFRAHKVVTASEGLSGEISNTGQRFDKKIISIEGTLDMKSALDVQLLPVEAEFDGFLEFKTIICIGRFSEQKGFDFIIKVFARAQRKDSSLRLLLIGDGPMFEAYYQLAIRSGLRCGKSARPSDYDVVFAGYKVDPVRYLKYGRVFAFPSRFEGLPNALIEACVAPIFVIAADCPWGPRSILEEDSVKRDVLPITVDTALPLSNGTLLPRINHLDAFDVWVRAIHVSMRQTNRESQVFKRLNSMRRFDIEESGSKWVRLIKNM